MKAKSNIDDGGSPNNNRQGNRRNSFSEHPRRLSHVLWKVFHSIWRQWGGRYALVVIGLWLLISLISLFWTPHSLWQTNGYLVWKPPSASHWLGTDGTGADVLSWLMAGSATNLLIAVLVVAFAALEGMLLVGVTLSSNTLLASGFLVVIDALISLPTVLLALILAVPLGPSIVVIVIACGIGYGLNLARIVRPVALLSSRSNYALSARSNGASETRILFTHVLPNMLPTMTVQLSLSAGTAMLAESGLTYLGVGVPSGMPSWGHSLASSVKFIDVAPITVLWPGLLVTVVVVALNLLGDALRQALDPITNSALRQVR